MIVKSLDLSQLTVHDIKHIKLPHDSYHGDSPKAGLML
jgi:hypothetical protein